MEINQINEILGKFFEWYNSLDLENMEESVKSDLITSKLVELGVFNIDLRKATEIISKIELGKYIEPELDTAVTYLYELSIIVEQYTTSRELANQLVNNPNIVEFASLLDQRNYRQPNGILYRVFESLNNGIYTFDSVRILEVIRDVFKYGNRKDNDILIQIGKESSDIVEKLNIDDRDKETVDNIIRELMDYIGYVGKNPYSNKPENSSYMVSHKLINVISSDDLKIDFCLWTLKNESYNDDLFCMMVSMIQDYNKRLELINKTMLYEKEVGKEYIKSFIVSEMFSGDKTTDLEVIEDKYRLLLRVMIDPKYKSKVNVYTINAFFESIGSDELIWKKYKDVENDSDLSQYINDKFVEAIISCFNSEEEKIKAIRYFYERKTIAPKKVVELLKKINDKSLLYDRELMGFFYDNIKEFGTLIVAVLLKHYNSYSFKSVKDTFLEMERRYVLNGRTYELLERYRTIGLIDDFVLNEVFKMASKYKKGLTIEETMRRIAENPNIREVIEEMAVLSRSASSFGIHTADGRVLSTYDTNFIRFETLFPKVRFSNFPDMISYRKMDLNLLRNFDLKVWNKLIKNPLFNQDDNAKKALVEIIAIFGLFEKDDQALNRLNQIINLFANQTDPLTIEELEVIDIYDEQTIKEYFDETFQTSYRLKDGVDVPADLVNWLSYELSMAQMSRVKRATGNIGSELTKFLSPYVKTDKGYQLRNGIQIDDYVPYLKPEMTFEEYTYLLKGDDVPEKVKNFLSPYEEIRTPVYVMKKSLDARVRDEIINRILRSSLNTRFTFENIHRIFDGLRLDYDPEFYQFFIENIDLILERVADQANFKEVKRLFKTIKNYYAVRGNSTPNYNDMLMFLSNVSYDIEFGNEEFAQDAKNTKVTNPGYVFYENLLRETRQRVVTTVPRHNGTYVYEAPDGQKYEILTRVLRADDPFNLLVGESNYTNCCQRYDQTGEPCMKHAATSKSGGIFATYLIQNGVPMLLTQSWFWTNENRACLDNIEATSLITSLSGEKKKLYQDMATYAIVEACKDMIKNAREALERFLEQRRKEIERSSLTEEEKQLEYEKLDVIRQRQTIHAITVGEGCDDLRVKESFREIVPSTLSFGPKGYQGYRDSGENQQHVIVGKIDDNLPDDGYVEVPVYRDERRITLETGEGIRYETLRKITDIESLAHKPEMVQYIKDGQFVITNPEKLASLSGCMLDNLKIIYGEDWYYVYSDKDTQIEIMDLAKKAPRISDEATDQTFEMLRGFKMILSDSIVLNNDGTIKAIKQIKADLREDTSYLLYLLQLNYGVIDQVGDDLAYKFNDAENKTVTTREQQMETLGNRRNIKQEGNLELMMHQVTFRPSKKTIEKLLEAKLQQKKNVGMAK